MIFVVSITQESMCQYQYVKIGSLFCGFYDIKKNKKKKKKTARMTRQGQQTKRCDKELNAMRFNLKEQRVLQKNLHILDAEASYSLKLIDLNNRGVKVFYKRFKDKVSKIKSHLRAEEIAELREMESRGELKDMHKPLNITGALRIADAEKRLQLRGHERQRKTKSAFTRRTDYG
ncbi:hypothetical protein KUTeg_017916 [Tegillarca granosa]|uniref:Uncharacterized protein n=1 Tax=Tegillarca granosa TaxID=220873 RepID=A0ABQ9EM38_TEGGR|nr:hypothetical protein KUTeg_017916 [Tegillarca granosa]